MRELRLKLRWGVGTLSCVAALGVAALSCGSEEEPPSPSVDLVAPSRVEITGGVTPGELFTGQRTLQAIAEDNSGRLAKVSFFVSGLPACADPEPRESGVTFSCTWDTKGFVEGDYQLVATAQDEAGNTAASDPIAFSVGEDLPPAISAVGASPTSVNEGQNTSLSVAASDPRGDALSYSWTQVSPVTPVGTFTGGDTATPTWNAPLLSSTTAFTLRVTVSDGKGGTAQRTVDLQVLNVASANRAPVVDAAITAPTSAIAGDTATLSIGATDPDGDPLTYTWRTNPAGSGTFTNVNTASTGWRSPVISADTSYTLQVTVSDGVASVTRSISVRATVPKYAADIQSIWDQKCTSCHSGASPSGGMNLSQGVSYGNIVNITGNNRCGTTTALRRVRPTLPDSSLLVRKIEGNCGTRMPQNDPNYFVSNPGLVTRIRSWILANAPNN
jgi:hypothetical protein